ncbi:MAG: hypothetical protein CMK32_12875 [Porticoccaceae bacterium]|nr:hypothetical protein [Porticoccaceae bacterium]
MTVEQHDPDNSAPEIAILALGFRPFFLLAGVWAMLAMALWGLVYFGHVAFNPGIFTLFQWHGHEMLFGYAAAVIAGFLLTSVKNWTGLQTPDGWHLAVLALLWLAARVFLALGGALVITGVLFNIAFLLTFTLGIGQRIFAVRQWRQSGILAVVGALSLAEIGVLIGLVEGKGELVSAMIYGAFYLVLVLILVMGRRVVPSFTERGVGYSVTLRQSPQMDRIVLAAVVGYGVNQVLLGPPLLSAVLAAAAFVCHTGRLMNWYTRGIWSRPLLWSLYLALVFVDLGFLLAALSPWLAISPYLVVHAFAAGGIGLVTLSMMCRVALGHTGRDVHNPPRVVAVALCFMVLAAVLRVLLPLAMPASTPQWVALAQIAWIVAFVLFVLAYAPVLFRRRVDGKPG